MVNIYQHMTPIERFATFILGKSLYPYQADVANTIIHFINHNEGMIITVMMSRESGKNRLSARIEALLLFTREEKHAHSRRTNSRLFSQLQKSLLTL